MRARVVVKLLAWCLLAAGAWRLVADPELRRKLGIGAVVVAALYAATLVRRRRRLGRASLSELDAMTGGEFEDYVAERVRAAGWETSAIFRRGDFGADFTAERDDVRVAIQAKRRGRNVGNRAVQEAAAGADFHACDAALVVTQARFTEAARKQANAARIPTALVDRDGLADLRRTLDDVLGAVERGRRR
jgi:HJR/Mrr/RecB family endonuclease